MREVLSVGGSARKLDSPLSLARGSVIAKEMKGIRMSSRPGYLDLCPEKIERLICNKPIEHFYDVEEQPFARGKYATVRRCRERVTGRQFAAKFLRKRRRSEDLRPEILHEVAVLEACSACPCIVNLHQVFESAHEMILLLELASGGELQMLLDKDEVPEERNVKRLMKEILDGLVFLHSINVAHLDIKPQNLVLTAEFPRGEVKLCDLGISRYISPGADIRDFLGTPDYVAPEVLNYEPISLATDMWSVGVILYVLLTGFSPFGGDTKQETFCNISQCRLDFPDDLFEDISENAKDLMKKLMVKDPSKRLSAQASLKHPWFSAVDSVPTQVSLTHAHLRMCEKQETLHITTASAMPRKIVVTTSQSSSVQQMIVISKPVPFLKSTAALHSREEAAVTVAVDSSSCPQQPSVSTELTKGMKDRGSSGMSSFRRNTFKKRMESLKQTYVEESSCDNDNNNLGVGQVNDNRLVYSGVPPMSVERAVNPARRLAPVNKAIAVQTMPVRGLDNTAVACRQVNVNVSHANHASVLHPSTVDKDTLYTFRRCIILGDSEDESSDSVPVKVLSARGSSNSSESGLGSYSDQSSSDSSSDTVSEMSVDSSSDRSSIISLDDSLMECSFSKVNSRTFSSMSCSPAFSLARSVWEMAASSSADKPTTENKLRPRECSNSSFSNVFTKFNIPVVQEEVKPQRLTSNNVAHSSRHQAPKYAHTSALNHVLISSASVGEKPSTFKKMDVTREQNGNVVVIRESKPGRYSTQFSEVKCESLQSRIKKLPIQGAKS